VEQRAERAAVVALSCGPDTALQLLWRDDRLCYTTSTCIVLLDLHDLMLLCTSHVYCIRWLLMWL